MIEAGENPNTPLVGEVGGSRWLMLVLYALIAASNAFMFMWLASVSNLAKKHYVTSIKSIHGVAQALYMGYIVTVPFAMSQFQRMGLRWTIIIAAVLNAAGAILRALDSLNFVLAGSFLVGVAISFFIGAPTWLSSSWFPEDERTTATAIAVLATQAGLALGFTIPPMLIHRDNQGEMIPLFHHVTAAVCIGIAILTAFLFRSEPRSLPPASKSFLQTVVQAGQNCQLVWVIIIFGIATGIYWTLLLVLCSIFEDNYSNKQIGFIGALYCFGGLASMAMTGMYFDWKVSDPPYRSFCSFCLLASTVFLAAFAFVAQEKDSLAIVGAICTLLGVCLPMVQPALLELAVEYSPDLSEDVSGSLLFLAAMVVGFFLPFLVDPPSIRVLTGLCIALGVCGIVVINLSPEYKRTQQKLAREPNLEQKLA